MKEELKIDVDISKLFRLPTLETLCRYIDGDRGSAETMDDARARASKQREARRHRRESSQGGRAF